MTIQCIQLNGDTGRAWQYNVMPPSRPSFHKHPRETNRRMHTHCHNRMTNDIVTPARYRPTKNIGQTGTASSRLPLSGMASTSACSNRSTSTAYVPSGIAVCHERTVPPNHSSCTNGNKNAATDRTCNAIRLKRWCFSPRNNNV